jgi:hypothetical protein
VALATLPTLYCPSYAQGFARCAGESAYPGLWRGLVAAWLPSLGPSGGELFDTSGYKNNGALTNMNVGSDWIPTLDGYALNFGGTNALVSTTYYADLREHLTCVFCGVMENAGLYLFGSHDGTNRFYYGEDIIGFGDSFVSGVTGMELGKKSVFALSGDGQTATATQNNNILSSFAYSSSGISSLSFFIGARNHASQNPMVGTCSACVVYNRVLSRAELDMFQDPLVLVRPRESAISIVPAVVGGHAGPLVNGPILKSKFRGLVGSLVA